MPKRVIEETNYRSAWHCTATLAKDNVAVQSQRDHRHIVGRVAPACQQIADELIIAIGMVKRHISNIYGKLYTQNRTHALTLRREKW